MLLCKRTRNDVGPFVSDAPIHSRSLRMNRGCHHHTVEPSQSNLILPVILRLGNSLFYIPALFPNSFQAT